MPLFGRRPAMGPLPHIAGIAELAAARGWTPAGDHPFGGELDLPIHRVSRVMYGAPAREPSYTASGGAAPTFYADAYRLAVDGRDVVIANAWTPMRTALSTLAHQRHGTAVCAVELPTVLMITAIESRRFRAAIPLRSVSTGDPAFDAMFRVTGVPGEGAHTLTPAARRLIMARDDWEFCAQRYLFCCVGLGPFESAQDVLRRVDEVLGIVAAFPTDTVPATVDHSADALIDRFSRIDTLE